MGRARGSAACPGIRLQVARGMLVFRDLEGAREAIRPVVSQRNRTLGWEAARLLALLDGGLVPDAGALALGLDPTVGARLIVPFGRGGRGVKHHGDERPQPRDDWGAALRARGSGRRARSRR